MTRSVRYQPILHTLYYTLHTEHAYFLSYRFLNNVVIITVIEMVEMVEKLDGRLGKRSVERVRYVINNLLHLVILKYGVISYPYYTQKHVITYTYSTEVIPDTRKVKYQPIFVIPWLSYFFLY